ncbi:MAG: gamma-glutamyl-gamma-aminobutyrate hydrolase family protein [Kiritimatiellae bacterium]|nr:gamma-glutamyl-gamma-aminobutyrate hydrolase family protein [Kiritimatiellia bacterium]
MRASVHWHGHAGLVRPAPGHEDRAIWRERGVPQRPFVRRGRYSPFADPAAVGYAVENVKDLLGKVPVMGICLGHQLLALACGAKTARLAFGHHGCNHPVKDLATGKVEITSQNHNFAVVADSLPPCLEVTHVNLNDGTIEGIRHRTLDAFSVQYHPESCPGPHDSRHLFDEFARLVGRAHG